MSLLHDLYVLLYSCLIMAVLSSCGLFIVYSIGNAVYRMTRRRNILFAKRPPLDLKERERRLYHAWVDTDRWDDILEKDHEEKQKP